MIIKHKIMLTASVAEDVKILIASQQDRMPSSRREVVFVGQVGLDGRLTFVRFPVLNEQVALHFIRQLHLCAEVRPHQQLGAFQCLHTDTVGRDVVPAVNHSTPSPSDKWKIDGQNEPGTLLYSLLTVSD